MEKDLLLEDRERKCNDLERQLRRRTDLDSKQAQLSNHGQLGTQLQSRHMKAMAGELNMNQVQVCSNVRPLVSIIIFEFAY